MCGSTHLFGAQPQRAKQSYESKPFTVQDRRSRKNATLSYPKYGFLTYKCAKCDTTKTVPLACKSRICPQCGKKHADQWVDELVNRLFVVPHRHMVFTMPEELWVLFEADQSLFKVLMDAVSNTMQQMLKDKHGAVPGVVCVLHPYGKELNLNSHVHVLLAEGGLTKAGECVPVSFLEYNSLRRIW